MAASGTPLRSQDLSGAPRSVPHPKISSLDLDLFFFGSEQKGILPEKRRVKKGGRPGK